MLRLMDRAFSGNEHDRYHAGEISRTRALLQDDDAWFVPDPPSA